MPPETITLKNLHSFCRTCLSELPPKKEEPPYNIQDMDLKIRTWLQDSTLQNPSGNDNIPNVVCDLCRDKLESFLEFHRMCSKSLKVFQRILEKNYFYDEQVDKANASVWQSNEMSVEEDDDDKVVETEVNCDWLDFDFIVLPKTQGEQQRPTTNKGEEHTTRTSFDSDCQNSSDEDSHLDGYNVKVGTHQEATNNKSSVMCDEIPFKNQRKSNSNNKSSSKRVKKQQNIAESMKTPSQLQRIRISCSQNPSQHVCEECGKVFDKLKELEKHQYSHKPPEEHPFFCTECNKIYKSQQTFKEHQLRHSGIKNFECPYCGVKKTTKNELQTHLNYHTKERQYLCPLCPMVFSRISNFRRHDEVVHQGLRRYICRYCEQAFGKPNTLKHHEMIHTGEKPHKCRECEKSFRQQVQLTIHMKVHNKKLRVPK